MIVFSDAPKDQFESFVFYYPTLFPGGIIEFNLSTYDQSCIYLNGVMPPMDAFPPEVILNDTDPIFDQYYFKYILEGPGFISFMRLASEEYLHGDRLILVRVERTPYKDSVMESVVKLLSSRYGIVSAIVSDVREIMNMDRSPSLSVIGLQNMSDDMIKYSLMYPAGELSIIPNE